MVLNNRQCGNKWLKNKAETRELAQRKDSQQGISQFTSQNHRKFQNWERREATVRGSIYN